MLPPDAALVIIDLQKAIDDPRWAAAGPRNNPGAEAVIARLLAIWREAGRPIFHIRHESTDPASTYAPAGPGSAFKPEAMPLPGEVVIAKQAHSAFIGTELEPLLRAAGIGTLVVAGVITNNSVEATVRMAADLGFHVRLVEDGCFTFARHDHAGRWRSAEEVHALSLANMDGEYGTVLRAADLI
ncbi:nicotinamidase-related amidase [Angulomicrobium tetraedrale]|uniref:Nicotinamidase-related amidase n=1 Tax=Ancylobacter tetraedralis TaxID=217068 RepID=A0A839Z841_9HYPH|nr:cysteine hydrolase family protein [Ancylobacter tetraedralis]MBB3770776.1 nicotinamidase-related amidase [Ancylobacter tetraedralis]